MLYQILNVDMHSILDVHESESVSNKDPQAPWALITYPGISLLYPKGFR